LPKAELHLHLEGTVTPESLSLLSQRHPTPLEPLHNRYKDVSDSGRVLTVEDARAIYKYTDFGGFLLAFKAVTERMRDPEDYELVTYEMTRQLHQEGVLHAEVFVSVGVVHWRGHNFEPLFEGMERGRKRGESDFGVSLFWIFDAVRHFGPDEAQIVVDTALRFRERNVVGIGIGGDEKRASAELFRDVYRYAAEQGLRLTAHAGESVGPESIWSAINDLHAERIGHGLHAWQDAELVRELGRRQIAVEACISSNVMTGCCMSLEQHPVRRYFDAGLLVTLNTDDPAMFHTTLTREYQIAQDVFGFSDDELRQLARNSFMASFLPQEKKKEYLARLEEAYTTSEHEGEVADHA
jgi:adenosine deaminase/aminodeoxyfutalosine deaminase